MAERTAQLLDAQAMNLDVAEVLTTIPPEWPLRVLSTFLSRSFRRTLHQHHESQLIKAISASENLAVAERTWAVLRDEGALVEEAIDDGSDGGVEAGEKVSPEEGALGLHLNEKLGLHHAYEDDDVVNLT